MDGHDTLRPADKIAQNFWRFHIEHPDVYRMFDHYTRIMIDSGLRNGSAALVAERIRWETTLRGTGRGVVKLNNNYRALYARLWEERNPERKGFFRKRVRRDQSADSINMALNKLRQE